MKSLFKKRSEPFIYHHYYLRTQKIWAEKMSGLADGLSRKKLICILILFTAVSCSYLIYNLSKAFKKNDKAQLNVTVISKIKNINSKNESNGK